MGSLQPHTGKCAFCTDIRITFFGLSIPSASFWYNHRLGANTVPGGSEDRISSNFHIRLCSALHEPCSLQPRTGKCAFCTEIRITFFSSGFPQLPFDTIIALVQTQYRGERKPWISSNFHIRPCSSLHETGYCAALYWEVRCLHRHKDYIFRLSILSASFWYNYCLGVNMVPWRKEDTNFFKFPYSALFGAVWNRLDCSPGLGSTLFAPT